MIVCSNVYVAVIVKGHQRRWIKRGKEMSGREGGLDSCVKNKISLTGLTAMP